MEANGLVVVALKKKFKVNIFLQFSFKTIACKKLCCIELFASEYLFFYNKITSIILLAELGLRQFFNAATNDSATMWQRIKASVTAKEQKICVPLSQNGDSTQNIAVMW